jgi:class 3 adenylate cyclase
MESPRPKNASPKPKAPKAAHLLSAQNADLKHHRRELKEAREQQAATAEILRIISTAPTDVQPVFEMIVRNAVSLCDSLFANVFRFDGELVHFVATASHNLDPRYEDLLRAKYPIRPNFSQVSGRVLLTKSVVCIEDVLLDSDYDQQFPQVMGWRRMLGVPMLRGGEPLGVIVVGWADAGPVPKGQEELLKTFADQAVIAIGNVRLFDELRARTAELEQSYSLVRQQASQLEAQSHELRTLNQQLEGRVAEQVGEIERIGRLRRFLPPQVADLIVSSGAEKQLESHRREITALFCDLRGFTGFSESSDPEDVMALLREYHEVIGKFVFKYNGTLERFAGDGVMVIFNDPVPMPNPALQAVRMALEMRAAIGALVQKWQQLGHDLGFGMGLSHGYATLGTIGFEGRFDYAAIGMVSNVASRLCGEAKPGQILVSPRVMLAVKNEVTVEPVGELTLKGIRRPMLVHNIIGRANSS